MLHRNGRVAGEGLAVGAVVLQTREALVASVISDCRNVPSGRGNREGEDASIPTRLTSTMPFHFS